MNRKKKSSGSTGQFEFRVVAGQLKGRVIRTPDLGVTRPPLTRLRKSLFDFLQPYLVDCRYLDLFSGTGSYLFEAVSRGAQYALGIELEPKLCDAIMRQASALGVSEALHCRCEDVLRAIPRLAGEKARFDIITLAPPQYKGIINDTLASLREHVVYDDSTLIICQHDTSETKDVDVSEWTVLQRRKYGNTTFTVLQAKRG